MKLISKHKYLLFYTIVVIISLVLLLIDFSKLAVIKNDPVTDQFIKANVEKINKEGFVKVSGKNNLYQDITVKFDNQSMDLRYGGTRNLTDNQKLGAGQSVILSTTKNVNGQVTYNIWSQYRLNGTIGIILFFFLVVLFITGKKGFGSLLGLAFSLLVIMKFIIPLIIAGFDPLLISIIGSLLILSVSIFLAHGLNEEISIAVISTFLSLIITGILAVLFVKLTSLSGLGSEDIYALQFRFADATNFQGLLLGGIIIGTLGVLDDVTTTQSATIYELSRTNPLLSSKQLILKGMRIGREHIASLVNTLVLAYAGASIGIFIFILLATQDNSTPLWVILNSELIIEEVVRTISGSIGLVLAVPITTVMSAILVKYSFRVK